MGVFASLVVVCFALAAIAGSAQGQSCSTIADCACGSQCIDQDSDQPCGTESYSLCSCQQGCVVAKMFIPAGTNNPDTYCNLCSCPASGPGSTGIPACSRRAWCNLPRDVPLYPNNPRCQTDA